MNPSLHCLSLCLTLACLQGTQQEAILQKLGSEDPAIRKAAQQEIEDMEAGAKSCVLRQGLRLEDRRAAAWCAVNLSWWELSNAEAPRYLQLLWLVLGQADGNADLQQFRSLVGSTELGRFLADLPRKAKPSVPDAVLLRQLGPQMRPSHFGQLRRLYLGPDIELAEEALEQIAGLLHCEGMDRDLTARTLLSRQLDAGPSAAKGDSPLGPVRPLQLTTKKEGYPPLLHAGLAYWFREDLQRLRPRPSDARIKAWLGRWALESRPAASDGPLLRTLLKSQQIPAQDIALVGLARIADRKDRDRVRAFAESGTGSILAWASLARMGDPKGLEALEAKAGQDALAMGFLLQLAPDRARPLVEEVLKTGTADRIEAILDLPRDDRAHRLGLELSYAKDFGWLESQLRRGQIPILSRIALLVHVPPFRNQSLLFALADSDLFRVLGSRDSDSLYQGDMAEFLGLLEASAPRQARRFLRGLARHEEKSIRDFAFDELLKIGDPESDELLIDHVRFAPEADTEGKLILLGRTKTDKVRAWLAKKAETGGALRLAALRGLGIAQGLPEELVWLDSEEVLDEAGERHVLTELRKGRSHEALVYWLDRSLSRFPDRAPAQHLGFVDDDRITTRLLALRKKRELGLYAWATGQLAMQGQAEARQEQEAVYRIGRRTWVDEADPWSLILGSDLTWVPFWIEDLGSGGNLTESQRVLFEQILGVDFSKTGLFRRPFDEARDWWRRAQGRLRYSHILDRYIIAARGRHKPKRHQKE